METPGTTECEVKDCNKTHCCPADALAHQQSITAQKVCDTCDGFGTPGAPCANLANVMHMMNQHEISDDKKQFQCAVKAKKAA